MAAVGEEKRKTFVFVAEGHEECKVSLFEQKDDAKFKEYIEVELKDEWDLGADTALRFYDEDGSRLVLSFRLADMSRVSVKFRKPPAAVTSQTIPTVTSSNEPAVPQASHDVAPKAVNAPEVTSSKTLEVPQARHLKAPSRTPSNSSLSGW